MIKSIVESALISLVAFSSYAYSQTISYEVSQVSATEYEYHYTITNDSSAPISEFVIYFDETLYSNLTEVSRPSGWGAVIVPPDTLLGDPGEYDTYISGPELAVGDSVGEFVVRFKWLGSGTPGTQSFDILDATTFATVYSGTTKAASRNTSAIPSTSLTALFVLLMSVLAIGYRKTSRG